MGSRILLGATPLPIIAGPEALRPTLSRGLPFYLSLLSEDWMKNFRKNWGYDVLPILESYVINYLGGGAVDIPQKAALLRAALYNLLIFFKDGRWSRI
jgi:hypothetical protein